MSPWACGIAGCGKQFEAAKPLIHHQATDHRARECSVCGETVPAGYLAIRHAFEEHTRAEYVRAYDADSDHIRERERMIEYVEEHVDVRGIVNRIETNDGAPVATRAD